MKTINQLAEFFNREVEVILSAQDTLSEYSVVATALKIERDGFESWKVHLFNFVDEFRRTMDTRLVILPPPKSGDPRIIAMLASSTRFLCDEIGTATPQWAIRRCFLSTPWFVSGMNSLKASALLESPLVYRMNNIFVHENFLLRA